MSFAYEFFKQNPETRNWWMYLFVHSEDKKLVGCGGFKAKPDDEGMVEISYAIADSYRGKGLATEAAQGLIDFAFSHPEINVVQAHTLAEENASVAVLRKLGMRFVKELHDPHDGNIWQWRLARKDYKNNLRMKS